VDAADPFGTYILHTLVGDDGEVKRTRLAHSSAPPPRWPTSPGDKVLLAGNPRERDAIRRRARDHYHDGAAFREKQEVRFHAPRSAEPGKPWILSMTAPPEVARVTISIGGNEFTLDNGDDIEVRWPHVGKVGVTVAPGQRLRSKDINVEIIDNGPSQV
jgi:hypothetical protein